MHLLVTDRLACVRCGPDFGLILLADKLSERRVMEGRLGCANCRETYPVESGFGDFRPPPRDPPAAAGVPATDEEDPEEAFRLAALLGVREGPGLILLRGGAVAQAERLAGMIEDIEVVALHPGLRRAPETPGVTRIDTAERLPFFTGSLRGVVLEGGVDEDALAEALRVLAPGARLVIRFPREGVVERLESLGLDLLLATGKAVVAARD
jgi:uncharacterized protein YbaR (Trm112 family)